jgi:hypothetical protein
MIHHVKEESSIKIQYGREETKGIYLQVTDKRLMLEENTKKEVKEAINSKIDQDGTYLNLYTGQSDKGQRVKNETIEVYFKRYNLPEDIIKNLLKPPVSKKAETCLVCKKQTTKCCQKCNCVFYCSRECQVKDWIIHKHYCQSLPIPPKVNGKNSVIGVLLDENAPNPKFVHVPLMYVESYGEKLLVTNKELFLKTNQVSRYWLEYNPLKDNKLLGNTLLFQYRDNFFNDGSQVNKCVKKLCADKNPHDWRGPMLITKSKGYITQNFSSEGFLDVKLTDFSDIIDFFLYYGSALNKKMCANNLDHLRDYNFNVMDLNSN